MFLRTEFKTYINNSAKTSTLKEFCFSTSECKQRMVVKNLVSATFSAGAQEQNQHTAEKFMASLIDQEKLS